jgi:NADPH:quinone reductase-like Zn-dependent oxidoreductase
VLALKGGVKLKDLVPQMVLAAVVVASIYVKFGVECIVTSSNDSTHSVNSLHFKGRALDFRTKQDALNGRERELTAAVKAALGGEFDVVLEAVGTDNEHLHVEWDPKG